MDFGVSPASRKAAAAAMSLGTGSLGTFAAASFLGSLGNCHRQASLRQLTYERLVVLPPDLLYKMRYDVAI